jgi:hypothetical protein
VGDERAQFLSMTVLAMNLQLFRFGPLHEPNGQNLVKFSPQERSKNPGQYIRFYRNPLSTSMETKPAAMPHDWTGYPVHTYYTGQQLDRDPP